MANPEHLDRLLSGVDKWNGWQKSNKGVIPDLAGANLAGLDLSGARLFGANLAEADLSGSTLTHALLGYSILKDANLTEVKAYKVSLSRADLRGAILARADVQSARFNGANLEYASARGLSGLWADFMRCNMDSIDLTQARLPHASFWEANMTNAVLDSAQIANGCFCRTLLAGASLRGANLSGASLNFTVANCANFSGANLSGCGVYALSVCSAKLDDIIDTDLVIDEFRHAPIVVDGLDVSQIIQLRLGSNSSRGYVESVDIRAVLAVGIVDAVDLQVIREVSAEMGHSCVRYDLQLPELPEPLLRVSNMPAPAPRPEFQDRLQPTIACLAGMARLILVGRTDQLPEALNSCLASNPRRPIMLYPTEGASLAPTSAAENGNRAQWLADTIRGALRSEMIMGFSAESVQ